MSKKRGFAASLITNENNLWVTGGAEGSQILSSTEYILKNGESIEGPKLPRGCLIFIWTRPNIKIGIVQKVYG